MNSQVVYLSQSSPARQHEYLVMIKALTAFNYHMFKNDDEVIPIEEVEELMEKVLEHKFNDLEYFRTDAHDLNILDSAAEFIPEDEMKLCWKEIIANAINEEYFMKASA